MVSAKLNGGTLDVDKVIEDIQQSIEWWEGLLKFSRGTIRPDKSFAYIIDFYFIANGAFKFKMIDQLDVELKVKDEWDQQQSLQIVNPSKGKETLEVFIVPDGNSIDQLDKLNWKVAKWIGAIRVHSLLPDELFAGVSSTIMKTLEYLAGASTFTQEDCNKLIKPIFDLTLLRCRICRLLPLALRYGARESMGLSFKNLFYTQGIAKLVYFIEERRKDSLVHPLLQANYEAALINIGIGEYKLFNISYDLSIYYCY